MNGLAKKFCYILFIFLFYPKGIISDENYYKILGVSESASQNEIKQAYKRLAKQWHPDKNKQSNAQEQFIRIGTAYETLSNQRKRQEYDQNYRSPFSSSHHYHYPRNTRNQYYSRKYYYHHDDRFYRSSRHYQINLSDLYTYAFYSFLLLFGLFYISPMFKSTSSSPSSSSSSSKTSTASSSSNSFSKHDLENIQKIKIQVKNWAPSIFQYLSTFLQVRGRRILLYFPNPNESEVIQKEKWILYEELARTFRHDPLIFAWIMIPTTHKRIWKQLIQNISMDQITNSNLIVVSTGCKKMGIYHDEFEFSKLSNWINRLIGGEISLKTIDCAKIISLLKEYDRE